MTFAVRYSRDAVDDLDRLYEFLLARATHLQDLEAAADAIDELKSTATGQLSRSPYSFRKAGRSSLVRELIISLGRTGYVALFEIQPPSQVLVLAIRHQLEADYH